MNPRKTALRLAATSGVAAVLCGMAAAPAVAADGDVDVVNTETVQVYTSPTGEIDTKRVYEQLILTGTGSVDLTNPISTDGLRNLEGFDGVDVQGGNQVTQMSVDGEEHLRSVSNFNGDLPLDVSVTYKLDGETVEPGDVVGESGELEVLYTVRNITGQPQEVSFPDGQGGTVTKTVDVPVPMVGSLTTVTPESFTNVRSDQANMAGDGKGGTKLSFTMTLFPPIGSDTAEFGYTADVVDGVVPRSDISALPVNPLESPTFAAAADSYQGGTDTGARLAEGAATIDTNLLKLRDGASELLAGLIKLHEGSAKLQDGLADEAAPGAQKLADGAGRLDDGLGQIADGANQLFDGTGQLVDGTRRLDDGAGRLSQGASDLAEGQAALKAGLTKLERGVAALPTKVRKNLKNNEQYNRLLGAMQATTLAIGTPNQLVNPLSGQPSLYGALEGVRDGLRTPDGYAANDCLVALQGQEPQQCGAMDAVQSVSDLLKAAEPKVAAMVTGAGSLYDYVVATSGGTCPQRSGAGETLPPLEALRAANAACRGAATLAYGLGAPAGALQTEPLGGLKAQTSAASDALHGVYAKVDQEMIAEGLNVLMGKIYNPGAKADCAVGASTAIATDDCGLQQAVTFFRDSIPVLVDGISQSVAEGLLENISVPNGGCDPANPTILCGSGLLADGADKLATGAGDLADGTGQLRGGAGELNTGAGQLADGTAEAADGSGQLADGADKLADGLEDAAEGSGKLTDGLGKAREGAPKLVDGAQQLSDKGTSKLVEAGEDTTQTYGQMYATIQAGAERAQTEDMAYGAPEGAAGLTAYSFVIQGEDGEAGRNWARGLAGMALLGLGGGGFLLRRRLI